MKIIVSNIRRLFFGYDWDIVEIEGALFKLTWGLWMLLPFPVFKSVSVYSQIASENTWGVSLAALGVIHLYAVINNKIWLRRVMCFIAFSFWLFTIILIYIQAPTASLLPTFSIIAFFMAMNFVRLGAASRVIR